MSLTQIYMASPDWLKLVLILAPCVTLVAVVALWSRVRMRALVSPPASPSAWPPAGSEKGTSGAERLIIEAKVS